MIPDAAPTVEDHEQIRAALIAAIAESSKTDIELSAVKTERDTLRAECDTLKTQHAEAAAEVEKLQNLVEQLRRTLYGSRSEKLDPDQLQLAFEDLEQAIGTAKAADEAATPREKRARRPGTTEPHRNRGALPANLPRIDVTIDVEDKTCPCCGGELHAMGEDVREMLDIVPPQLRDSLEISRNPQPSRAGQFSQAHATQTMWWAAIAYDEFNSYR